MTDETVRSRDGRTVESMVTDYQKFPLWHKLNPSLTVGVSPQRLCLFTVMADFCKQDGRSNRQNPDDLCYKRLSFCAPRSALSATHFLGSKPNSTPELAVQLWKNGTDAQPLRVMNWARH